MLDAETLQQNRHIMFAVRCSYLRRRPPVPVKLPRVDVPRLVQVLPYLLHHVRLAVQPWQKVARCEVRGGHQVVLQLARCAASHEEHLPGPPARVAWRRTRVSGEVWPWRVWSGDTWAV